MRINPVLIALVTAVAIGPGGNAATAQIIETESPQAAREFDQIRLFDRTRIIVKFVEGADPDAVMSAAVAGDLETYREGSFDFAAQATGATLVDLSAIVRETESTVGPFGVERIGGAESAEPKPLDRLIERLNADPRVEYAQKNYLEQAFQADLINTMITGQANGSGPEMSVEPKAPNDLYFAYQWHLKLHGDDITETEAPGAVNFPEAWRAYHSRRDIVVAVVDNGQVFDHEDVASDLLLPGYDFISHSFIANDGDGRDDDPTDPGNGTEDNDCFEGSKGKADSWHGSHVSGIAGLAVTDNEVGIASAVTSGVSVLPVRAIGRCGGLTSDLADAMMWAAGIDVPGIPPNPNPAIVINASFGGPSEGCKPLYRDALRQIRERGAIVVAAAGNSKEDAMGISPAGCDDAFTVAASDMIGALSPYSNYGAAVDILAPGGNTSEDLDENDYVDGILSIVAGGYGFKQGTSMAAPLVSAALALTLSHNPSWTVEDAMERMTSTAMPRTQAQCGEPCGAGLMDAAALLD